MMNDILLYMKSNEKFRWTLIIINKVLNVNNICIQPR